MNPPRHVVSVQTTAERGGGEYANVDLLDALARQGWRVSLVTNLPDLADGRQVPVHPIDLGPKLSRSSLGTVIPRFPLYAGRLVRALRAEAKAAPIDAVLLHYKKEQLMSPLLRGVAARVVWAEWGPLPFEFRRGPARVAYAAAARSAAAIACVSEGTRRTIADAGVDRARTTVIPNLVDTAAHDFDPAARARLRREWGVDDAVFVVGCVSRLHPKKRNDVVIDMLDHLPAGRDVLLVMAGDGSAEAGLRAAAARFGERVRFMATPRGWVEQFLSACDVQVFAPSPTEGAPRSIVLGQLARRAIIATAGEGADDMLAPGTGTIVSPPHDPRALARTVAAYRDDPERGRREGEAARAHALAAYDPARTVAAYAALLRGERA